MRFSKAIEGIEGLLAEKFRASKAIKHRGERGRAREASLREMLEQTLPAAYGVATGELLPYRGAEQSPQCDVILYDRLHFPVLHRMEAVQLVPLDACYAVIEVRSLLDAQALKDADAKFTAIRKLPRCPVRRAQRDSIRGPLFILFGYTKKASTEAIRSFVEKRAREGDTFVVALDHGFSLFIEQDGVGRAVFLRSTSRKDNLQETLSYFLAVLLDQLAAIDLGSPRFFDLLAYHRKD